MDTSLDARAADLFKAVIDRDAVERVEFLDNACGSDAPLRAKVEVLLRADEAAAGFLDAPAAASLTATVDPATAMIGKTVGAYRIDRLIGLGGMGTVYEATQQSPRRTVAIKLMRSGIASASTLRRFEYESQVLARLRHPGVVQVYEAGVYSREDDTGVPYFAMEYVPEARNILEFARERGLDTRERLSLFSQVCDAVHHGHQIGIIHRDLKPGNILVDAGGQPKVIDFGVARAIGSDLMMTTVQSGIGQIIGTLRYMSPEQCDADPLAIDVRSDVYALGVVLYELLTGKPPYDPTGGPVAHALRVIREAPPGRLSAIDKSLRGDIETIVSKCLTKERERRYQGAGELAEDIRRHLSNQPIEARRDSAIYVFRKMVRRHRFAFAAMSAFIVLLTVSTIIAWTLLLRARDQYESAQRISEFYASALLRLDPGSEAGLKAGAKPEDILLPDLLRDAVRRIPESFKDRPDLAAGLALNIGQAFRGLALREDAERVFRESFENARQSLGENHLTTLILQRNLGSLIVGRCAFEEGVSLLADAADRTVRLVGEDHALSLEVLTTLAWPMYFINRLESEQLSNRAVAIAERTLPETDPRYVDVLAQHGMLYAYLRKAVEGERFARRAVEAARKIGNGKSIYLAMAITRLSTILEAQRRLPEALAIRQESIELWHGLQGEYVDAFLQETIGCSVLVSRLGRCDEALKQLRPLLALSPTQLNRIGIQGPLSRAAQVIVFAHCGQAIEAERIARDELAKLAGATTPPYCRQEMYIALASSLETQGKSVQAEEAVIAALGQVQPRWINNGSIWGDFENYPLYGRCMIRLGDYEEAEWRLLDAHQRLFAAGKNSDALGQQVVSDLVTLYETWGKPDKAVEFRPLLVSKQNSN